MISGSPSLLELSISPWDGKFGVFGRNGGTGGLTIGGACMEGGFEGWCWVGIGGRSVLALLGFDLEALAGLFCGKVLDFLFNTFGGSFGIGALSFESGDEKLSVSAITSLKFFWTVTDQVSPLASFCFCLRVSSRGGRLGLKGSQLFSVDVDVLRG